MQSHRRRITAALSVFVSTCAVVLLVVHVSTFTPHISDNNNNNNNNQKRDNINRRQLLSITQADDFPFNKAAPYHSSERIPKAKPKNNAITAVQPLRIVEFPSCGGLSNQRISIAMGLTIAYLMNRTAILPTVQEDFIQDTPMVPFDRVYDADRLIRTLAPHMQIWKTMPPYMAPLPRFDLVVNLKMLTNQSIQYTRRQIQLYPRVRMNCPFFGINLNQDPKIAEFYWMVDDALSFNSQIMKDAQNVVAKIGNPDFVFLHARIEQDWKDHCKVWNGDNCYTDPGGIRDFMVKKSIPSDRPIYLAGISVLSEELAPLVEKYSFISKETLIGEDLLKYDGKRDLLAAIDYVVAENAKIFIGNSVSTFSALHLIQRIDKKLPNYHYNQGIIPLIDFVPSVQKLVYRLSGSFAWIFAMNNRSSAYDEMAKVAVASAYMKTSLRMYCLYDGAPNEMTKWMESLNVKVIHHSLTWFDRLKAMKINYNPHDPSSTNYGSPESLAATFIRSDIPIMDEFEKEDYVLYTDIDIVFLKDIRPADIRVWPRYFACGPEDKAELRFPCNMGIMLMNMQSLRSSHKRFLEYVLGSENMRFTDGPADQGAYNGYYKGRIDGFPTIFNWKPYWRRAFVARILHFHGPKAADYQAWLSEGRVLHPPFEYLLKLCDTGACREHMELYNQILDIVRHDRVKQSSYRNQLIP